jgi:predicted ATPase/DNA-binding CsgD family transcriptional regulator
MPEPQPPVRAESPNSILPAGTVTFLVTDADRSRREPDSATIAAHHGVLAEGQPPGIVAAAFESATDALGAAGELRQAGARLALHTGDARLRDGRRYTGPALQRCIQLHGIARAGQALLSSQVASLVADRLPEGTWLEARGTHRLRDLSHPQRVFELRSAGDTRDPAPLRSLDALPNNLPAQMTNFVGRDEELAAVRALLDGERSVTITGPGGCGKTRLALQGAAQQSERWPDGVWWVELASTSDPALVSDLAASVTGVAVEPVGGPLRALTLQLRDRRVLLCLDNCEHVLPGAAELASAVLQQCPEVTVLATSREPLGVVGETVWQLPSLAEDEAVSLFVERASRVRPWFTLDVPTEAAVRTMCRRIDGIPLAVELAAAWLRTLTPAQILAGLDDRFTLLVRGPRGVDPRQQTLAASMAWSHNLLDEADRVVFRRLSVFAGGFTLDAAQDVCSDGERTPQDVLDSLGRLVDKSLVVMDDAGGDARYRLLETIRQYAGDRLAGSDDASAVRERHLRHYVQLLERADVELDHDQDAWRAVVEAEHDNLRDALDWGLDADDPEPGRRLAAALAWLWTQHRRGHEGVELLQRAIARAPDDRTPLQARLLTGLALVADTGGPLWLEADAARRGLELAIAVDDQRSRGRCLLLAGVAQLYVDFDTAWDLGVEAKQWGDACGDAFASDGGTLIQGIVLSNRSRHDEAAPLLAEGIERCLRRHERLYATVGLGYVVEAAAVTGDLTTALRLGREVLELARPMSDYYFLGSATSHLSVILGMHGDLDGARRLMQPILDLVEGAGKAVYVPRMASTLGKLALWAGDLEEAVQWFERDARSTDPAPDNLIVARSLPGFGTALRMLGRTDEAAEVLDHAVRLARGLDVPNLVADALEQTALLVAERDPERAESLQHESLAVRVDHGLRTYVVDNLDGLGALAQRAGSLTESARLLAASDAGRAAMGYPRQPVATPAHEAQLAVLQRGLGAVAFNEAWNEGAALALDDAVAYVRRARGTRGRPSTGWASLTPTELEVVRLVVDGLTNPEIGTRLLMSRGTVKTHLSHVFAKLGVANRTELATLASQQPADG